MRLKSLTLKGFKSFADETEINFSENLIGIVGPNGSGKSNIVDAIRWVLGEQKTSELRLEAMSDVLFNGSKDRKEGKVARVTLLFDNTKHILPTEYSEVNISRVLYRDGNSEYRLNNVPCRKKDITSLFVDSGIGPDSYAIISLNMVEDILHDKGGYRRKMIEQAAGISKYKIRKQETLNKLKSTTEDLDRVEDLLFEIQKNMNSFERQAKRTEKYNKLKEQYRELSLKLAHLEVRELKLNHQTLGHQLIEQKDKRSTIHTQIIGWESELEKLKFAILDFEKGLNEEQQNFNSLIEKLGKKESEKSLLLQHIDNAAEKEKYADNRIKELRQAAQSVGQQIVKANSEEPELMNKVRQAEQLFEDLSQTHRKLSGFYEDLREQEKAIKRELSTAQDSKNRLIREQEALRTRLSVSSTDIGDLKNKVRTLQIELKENELRIENASSRVEERKLLLQEQERKISETEQIFSEKQQFQIFKTEQLNKLKMELSSIEQRIRFLQNIIENHEGLPESVKYILSESGDKKISFADLVEVIDDKYLKIIELFLEPYLHYVIASDRGKAITYYKSVREAQKGKLRVFILEEQNAKKESIALKVPADSIELSKLLRFDTKYEALISQITRGVFISQKAYESFDFSSVSEGQRILFPDDFLIYSKSELYGGSNTLFEGVQLGRKKIVEKLEEKAIQLRNTIEQTDRELFDLKEEIGKTQSKLKEEREYLSALKQGLDQLNRDLYQIESVLKNLQSNIKASEEQIIQKESLVKETSLKEQEVASRLDELSRIDLDQITDSELSNKIEDTHRAYLDVNSRKEKVQFELFEVRNQYNSLKREIAFKSDQVKDINDQLSSMESDIAKALQLQKDAGENLERIEAELKDLYVLKASFQRSIHDREESYYKEKGKIFELEKKVNEQRAALSRLDELIQTLSDKYNETGFAIKSIYERNSIEFGVELSDNEEIEWDTDEELDQLRESKSRIQDRIRSYGDINPMAITAYNEIKIRYDNIFAEREDVLKARTDLENTIDEIEVKASNKFNESLELIRKNFRRVFQGLFSDDDDCDIVLLENDSPLEAHIEIVAKPKGKKPKSISQLSGGEKTLTAASFLFALYLLKPAPFCIFDEVDAPLDDINVQKFNKLVRKFSGESQFIIITHNKLTMAEVDILYGVFLKEPGVSGVGAVDFREYEQANVLEAIV